MTELLMRLSTKAAAVSLLVSALFVVYLRNSTVRFVREHERLESLYSRFEKEHPSSVKPEAWKEAWGWTQTAIINVTAPGHVDIEELRGPNKTRNGGDLLQCRCWWNGTSL